MPDLSLRTRAKSFADAGRGLAFLLASQPHAWFHAAASVAVVALGLWLALGAGEWCWLVLAISGVWIAEAFNTALESLADALHPEQDPAVGRAKDVAAGAVGIAAIAAVVIGLLVLGPPLWARLG